MITLRLHYWEKNGTLLKVRKSFQHSKPAYQVYTPCFQLFQQSFQHFCCLKDVFSTVQKNACYRFLTVCNKIWEQVFANVIFSAKKPEISILQPE